MKSFIVFSCLLAVAVAKPGFLAYSAILPGAPIGADGRVVDTPEVNLAKLEHAAAHVNERLTLDREALRSGEYFIGAPAIAAAPIAAPLAYTAAAAPLAYAAPAPLAIAAPYGHYAGATGPDGRPLDTPEVALAKAEHAAHHINDRIVQANEAARNFFF